MGPEIFGSSLGQLGYDVVSTTANMLPSMALGAIHPALGAASIGLSAGGNAYNQAIQEGYTKDQARAYAVLSGASEAGLQYFLGGISKLGNNVIGNTALGKQVAASIQNIQNANLRIAAKLGTKMLSEASEEYLQAILEPVYRNMILGEDNEFHFVTEEAAYAVLLAIITTGVVEGPEVVGKERQAAKNRPNINQGKFYTHSTDPFALGMNQDTWSALQGTAKEMYVADQAQKTAAQTDGGGRYSLKEFGDGRRFVDVDTDQSQFDGLTLEELGRQARKVIKGKFKGKVIGIENRVFVNGETAKEYGHPDKKLPPLEHEAKMRASTELDNLLDAGTNFRTEPDGRDGHIHPEAVGDFRYFDTVFKVGEEYYSGVVNIMPVAKGLLLKDITKIENITQDIHSSYGDKPQTTFLRDASMNSIPQPGGKSNSDFFLKTGEDILTQTAQQMDEAGKEGWRKRNEEAIKNAASTFGKHGSKLLQEFYRNSDLASDEYYGGFAAYYHAGLTGQDITQVKSEYAQNLNPAQAEAAYLAGQLDAAAEQTETLPGEGGSGTIEEVNYIIKEDMPRGKAREETREAFTQRVTGEGYTIQTAGAEGAGETVAYGYRDLHSQGRAGAVWQGLNDFGVPAFTIDGTLWQNQGGRSRLLRVSEAMTVPGVGVFISAEATLPPKRIEGHEAFHFWRGTETRKAYNEILTDNLDFSSDAFKSYMETFEGFYFEDKADISDTKQVDLFTEELFAYISGDLHEGGHDAELAPMFRDFDAVKAAWENLVESQKSAALME